MYNYRQAIEEDILQYLNNNYKRTGNKLTEDEKQKLYDTLRIEDSVTWNASGSYTFNTYKAQENLLGNRELLRETVWEFSIDITEHYDDYEYLDVSIRCYLLGECLENALHNRYSQWIGTEEELDARALSDNSLYND